MQGEIKSSSKGKMRKEDADEIVRTLEDKRLFTTEKITEYLASQGYLSNKRVLIRIMISMAESDKIFPTLFVRDQILNVATKSEAYANLVSELARRNMTMPLSKLTELYKKEPSAAMYVYHKLEEAEDPRLATAMGYILGGMGGKIYPNRNALGPSQ